MLRPLIILCSVLTLASCDELENLPAGDVKSPQYWGDFFLNKFAAERQAAMENIEEGPPRLTTPRTVLLVTGVTIPAAWFDAIKVRLERDGFIPVVYEPPNLLSGDLLEASHQLAEVVERVQAESGQDKIDILAECTGGLIARYYVQSLGGDEHVDRLVTFVSPQNGVEKAPLAENIVGWPALRDLTPGSDFLKAVHAVPLPESVDMTSIYTCTDEYIQPYTTSIVEGATNIGLCDEFVGHFQTMYDPEIYLIMHAALVKGLGSGETEVDPNDDNQDELEDEELGGCAASGSPVGLEGLLFLGLFALAARRRQES